MLIINFVIFDCIYKQISFILRSLEWAAEGSHKRGMSFCALQLVFYRKQFHVKYTEQKVLKHGNLPSLL